jgi:hypothetical protein
MYKYTFTVELFKENDARMGPDFIRKALTRIQDDYDDIGLVVVKQVRKPEYMQTAVQKEPLVVRRKRKESA